MPDTLTDTLRRRETRLQRFANGIVNSTVTDALQVYAVELAAILNQFGDVEELTMTQRRKIVSESTRVLRENQREMWNVVTIDLEGMAVDEGEFIKGVYDGVAASATTPAVPAKIVTRATRAPMVLLSGQSSQAGVWAQFTKRNVDSAAKAVQGAIFDGFSNGQSNAQILKSIRGTFNKKSGKFVGGILDGRTKAQAGALIRTGTNHYANEARDQFYSENTEILGKRILIATRDRRTTLICISRDRSEFDIEDDSYPRLPFHFNERSVYTVTLEGEELTDIEQRESWDSFLRKQDRSFVEDTLGKKRADLFIDGKVKIEKFTDMTGKTINLKELKEDPSLKKAFDTIEPDL